MNMTRHKVGGGCRPTGMDKPSQRTAISNILNKLDGEFEKKRKERQRKHEEWLASPAGIEVTRLNDERLQKIEQDRIAGLAETKRRNEYGQKAHNVFQAGVHSGDIIKPRGQYMIEIGPHKHDENDFSAIVRINWYADYPHDPTFVVGDGRRGLVLFLDQLSRCYLRGQDDMETFIAFQVAAFWPSIKSTMSVKILDFSRSRNAAHGCLIMS